MANNEPKNTEPLWFLDGLDDGESKLFLNESTENENSKDSGNENLFSESIENSDYIQSMKDSSSVENKSIGEKDDQEKIIEDEISLKSELEKSLFDLAKESINKGDNPEFRITISSNNKPQSEQNISSESSENAGAKVIKISSFDTEMSKENKKNDIIKPKMFVIIKSNQNMDSKSKISEENAKSDKAEEVCSEIGSSVINLNDFISPQAKPVTGAENISTSLNFMDNEDDKRKVELVITIKDERSKPSEETVTNKTYRNEMNTDFPNLDSLLIDESLDSEMKSLSERADKFYNRTSTNSKASTVRGNNWSESKDSYIRGSDGARCYRTVTSTPWGRRVHTQCYKDDRRNARRHDGWTSGVDSFLREVDDDFNRMFTRLNRLVFY